MSIFRSLLFTIIFLSSLFSNDHVTLQLKWKHQFQFAGFYAAIEQGYYKDTGIDLTLKELNTQTPIDDVLNGKADFGVDDSILINQRSLGKDLVAIMSIFEKSPYILLGIEEFQKSKDFHKKVIEISKYNQNLVNLTTMMKIIGGDYIQKDPTFSVNDLIAKKTDFYTAYISNEPYQLLKRGYKPLIYKPYEYGLDFYGDMLYTSQKLINKNPDLVRRFYEASYKGWLYAFNHIDETSKLILKKYNTQNKTLDALLYEADTLKKLSNLENFGKLDINKIKTIASMYAVTKHAKYDLGSLEKFIYEGNHRLHLIEQKTQKIDLTVEEKKYLESKKVLKIHAEKNWSPFSFEKDGKLSGYLVDLQNLLAQKLNIKIEFSKNSWGDDFLKLKNNNIDLMFDVTHTKKRENDLLFSSMPIMIDNYGILSLQNFTSLESLHNKKVATLKGSFVEDIIRKEHPQITLISGENNRKLYEMLINKKVDAILDTYVTHNEFIATSQLGIKFYNNIVLDQKFEPKTHIATSKTNQILINIINKALDPNEIQKLKLKWNLITVNEQNNILTQEENNYLSNKKTLKVYIDQDWRPYEYIENGVPKGYLVDVQNLLATRLGLQIERVKGSWDENFDRLKLNDNIDLMFEISKNKERESYLLFSELPLQSENYAIVSFENITTKEQLAGKKIGIEKGTIHAQYLKDAIPNGRFVEYSDTFTYYQDLINGKLDAIYEDYTNAHLKIDAMTIGKKVFINVLALKQEVTQNHIATHKSNTTLMSIINKTITKDDILELQMKWGLKVFESSSSLYLSKLEKNYLEKNQFNIYVTHWEPITIVDKNKPTPFNLEGIAVDLLKEIAQQTGMKYQFIPVNDGDELNEKLKNDPYGVAISLSLSDTQKDFVIGSSNYHSFSIAIATKNDQNFKVSMHDFVGKTIAISKTLPQYDLFIKQYPQIKFKIMNSTLEAIDLVAKGEADGVADIIPVLTYHLDLYQFDNLKINAIAPQNHNLQIIANKNNLMLIEIVNKVLGKLDNDYVHTIHNKWINIKEIHNGIDIKYILYGIITILILIGVYSRKVRQKEKKLYQELDEYKNTLEEKVKEQTAELISVIDNIPAMIYVKDVKNLNFIHFNHACEEFLGVPREKALGKNDHDFFPKELADKLEAKDREVIAKDELFEVEEVLESPRGKRVINAKKVIIKNEQGEPLYLLGISQDITNQKERDLLFLQQSKMASLGEMIGNIAHQWRQPLSVISTSATGLQLKEEMGTLKVDDIKNFSESIFKQAQYLSNTIDTFRNFIKPDKQKSTISIFKALENSITLLDHTLKHNHIKLINNVISDNIQNDIQINIPLQEFSQVIVNIINNAKDVLLEHEIIDPLIEINYIVEENKLIYTIEDNGGGIPDDVLPHIFEPYFTTKHKSQGTGLGLNMSYRIMTDSIGGNLYAKNTQNGAKFYIEIPLEK